MFPLQFIFLLIIISLPGQLARAASQSSAVDPTALPTLHIIPAWAGFVSLFASQALLAALVVTRTRRAIRLLNEPATAATPIAARIEQLTSRARWATGCLIGIHLFATPIAPTAFGWFAGTHILKYLLIPELLFLLPAVLAWLVFWIAGYHLEAAIRDRNRPYLLARQEPVHEMPSLGAYLAIQIRHNFYPFLFLLFQGFVAALAAAIARASSLKPDDAEMIATLISAGILLATLPMILVRIWSTTPLTGDLRTRLDQVAQRHRLRFRNILLWRSHNTLINAAILGWLPRGRYFLMSDSLMEMLTDDQLESVFAHEVGHGVHRHLPWLVLAVLSSMALAAGVGALAVLPLHLPAGEEEMVTLAGSSVLLCVFAGTAVWFISPRFEHQADWFACRHMATRMAQTPPLQNAEPSAMGQGVHLAASAHLAASLTELPTPAEAVTLPAYAAGNYPHSTQIPAAAAASATTTPQPAINATEPARFAGTEVFISSLESILEGSHRDRRRRGWFHPSPANRLALLRELTVNPAAAERFEQKMRRTRYAILTLAAAATVAFVATLLIPERKHETPATQPAATASAPTGTASRP